MIYNNKIQNNKFNIYSNKSYPFFFIFVTLCKKKEDKSKKIGLFII